MRPRVPIGLVPYLLVAIGVACGGDNTGSRFAFSPASPPRTASPEKATDQVARSAVGSKMRSKDLGPRKLSLEEAALSALRNNRDLRVQQLIPKVQGAFAEIARGEFDTELFADFQYGQARSVETSRSTEERFDVDNRDTSSVLGVRQRIATGTTLEATVEHDYSHSNRTPDQQRARLGLTVTQALLQGLGPSVNLAVIEQADLEVRASLYELHGYTEAILAQTEDAYWRYILAEREIAIYQESLDVARQQRDEIEQEIEVGTLAKIESAAAHAEVALREQDLIDARSELEQQRVRLLRLIGANLGQKIIVTSDPSIAPLPITNIAERIDLAVRSRAEIKEALLRHEQKRLETVITRNGLLPRLDLFVTLGKTGFAETFSNSFGQLDGDTYDVLAGVRFSYMIQSSAADGKHRVAIASREQAKLAIENLRQLVKLQVRLAITEVERARQQITASTATRELQEQKLIAEQERFSVGESTALMLAQAQRDLLSSRIAEVKALVDYRSALVQLYLAEGTLLERRGIRVKR